MNCTTLFVTGVARGGTTLVAQMVAALSATAVAVDPALPLFKALRSAAAATVGELIGLEPALGDYYGCGVHLLDAILAANPDRLAANPMPALREALRQRARHENPDLLPALSRLRGPTIGDALREIHSAIKRAPGEVRLVGIKEVWIAEFFPALKRIFPEAVFIVILRDPRAVLHSMLALSGRDPLQMAHPLSFLRGWRKCAALAFHLQTLLGAQLLTLRYEDLVEDPAAGAEQICAHVGLSFEKAMLGEDGLPDRGRGGIWPGNSSFQEQTIGVSAHSRDRWKRELSAHDRALVEYLCAPEMALWGYAVPANSEATAPGALIELVREQSQGTFSWRSDSGDGERDMAFEAERRSWWAAAEPDGSLARHYFLFDEVAQACRRYRPKP